MADAKLHAVLAEFNDPARLLAAARALREQGFARLDAYTPFPVAGLASILAIRDHRVPLVTLAGGVAGLAFGFGLQVWGNLAYAIPVGGRPLVAPPAFILTTFALGVLAATFAAVLSTLLLNRLPKLNHSLFDAPDFGFTRGDRFFVAILAGPGFDRDAAGKALAALHPRAIIDVPARP